MRNCLNRSNKMAGIRPEKLESCRLLCISLYGYKGDSVFLIHQDFSFYCLFSELVNVYIVTIFSIILIYLEYVFSRKFIFLQVQFQIIR